VVELNVDSALDMICRRYRFDDIRVVTIIDGDSSFKCSVVNGSVNVDSQESMDKLVGLRERECVVRYIPRIVIKVGGNVEKV
jgi:hypothetical protein